MESRCEHQFTAAFFHGNSKSAKCRDERMKNRDESPIEKGL